ncbi:MAG: hypothetical protein ABI579_07420, partial [Candidatus Sumerlaeota bacterium]
MKPILKISFLMLFSSAVPAQQRAPIDVQTLLETPVALVEFTEETPLTNFELNNQMSNALAGGALTFFQGLRAVDPSAQVTVTKLEPAHFAARLETKFEGLQVTIDYAFLKKDDVTKFYLRLKASAELNEEAKQLARDMVLKEYFPKCIANKSALSSFYEQAKKPRNLSELFINMSRRSKRPVKYMNEAEVRGGLGQPMEQRRILGRDIWSYRFVKPDDSTDLITVYFKDG